MRAAEDIYLLLELRAYVCGARVGEVVVESGGVATAIFRYQGRGADGCRGPSRAIRTLCVMCVMLPYIKIRLSPLLMILESLKLCLIFDT